VSEWFAKRTFAELLDKATEIWGTREALLHEGRRYTFAELKAEVDAVAHGLIALGVAPGDKVALWMPNRPEWVFAFFAVSKIGGIVVPVNTRFRANDLEYVVHQSDATTLITVDRSGPIDYLELTQTVIPEVSSATAAALDAARFPELRRVIVLGSDVPGGAIAWSVMLARGREVTRSELKRRDRQVKPDDTTLIMYTSGTTGFPKGVMHCHNLQRNVVDIANRLGYRPKDVILMNWPLFHVLGLYLGPLFTAGVGTRMVLTTTFDPAESLRLIERERITRLWGFESQLNALTQQRDLKSYDLSSLRTGLGVVGMPSSELAARRAYDLLCPIVSGYGMTETGAGIAIGYPDAPREDAWFTSGYPLPGMELKVIDPTTGSPVAHGEQGELCVRGYSLMQGYYKKPEETAKTIDQDGWLHTGDLATQREDGSIRFLGRIKDMLKVGGENVDPAEVELFLSTHPAVAQVQIVGVPDKRLSEVACACVIPKSGCVVTNDDLAAFSKGKLASFKTPRHTVTMGEFPMTASGKPQKVKLRAMTLKILQLDAV
jgi:fatty-acyl-CoA synthase